MTPIELRHLSFDPREASGPTHYSGILVTTDPVTLDRCRRDLEALPGVEVHFCYPDSGRLIAVQETATAREQEEGLRRIQKLPSVKLAALVEHRVEHRVEHGVEQGVEHDPLPGAAGENE